MPLVQSKKSENSPHNIWYALKLLLANSIHPPHISLQRKLPHQYFLSAHNETNKHTSQGTNDVRLDPQLNKKVWETGVKHTSHRLRVRISRRRNDEEGAKERLYSYVQAVNVKSPKGLQTVVVETEEE